MNPTRKYLTNRVEKVRRSTLIVPGHVEKYVSKAFQRGADAVQLDLEDGVPCEQKGLAREMVKETLHTEIPGETEVNVRINAERDAWLLDLESVVWPRLDSITLPKCEDPAVVKAIDDKLGEWEEKRGIQSGRIQLSLLIESVKGLHALEALLGASGRISTVTLGNEDFTLDLGIEPSESGQEMYYYYSRLIYTARLYEVMPLGFVSSIAGFRDLERYRELAEKSRRLGFMGASCIHPDQVAILNQVFSPGDADVAYARRVVEAYETAVRNGRASCSLDGKMIDPPVYQRAVHLLRRHEIIERKKGCN
ncbi:CoA ester lyase [Brevibacillus sp. SYP-B805]|uniref:HpcH/HpaI aldolase/citrate lyase family protein n=1 Tax=Brevibacillus sp. SYP-B805 TaxID=1578199 RepID=UPI0013ED24F8|nr:CoA ester lyase [Brevibacillus sp. SYP-B805]NGQ95855.1 CoA ester lyase [Brevibacillus sp. SYP-B805]